MPELDLADLGRMPFESILPMMETRSRLTREEIARGMRESLSVINRSFDPAADYFFRIHRVPFLCHLLEDDLLIRWLAARYAFLRRNAGTEPAAAPLSAGEGLLALAALMREVGEAAAAIEEGARDGDFNLMEARRVKRELLDVVSKAFAILAGIEGVIAARKGA